MNSFFSALDRAGRILENALLVLLLGGIVLLAVGQIVMREVFSGGFVWADGVIKLLVLWLAMIGSLAASRDNRHIRIDALAHVLSARTLGIVRIIVDLFAAGVCAVIAWHAWRFLDSEYEFGTTIVLEMPAWAAFSVVPAAFALMAFRFAVLAGRQATGRAAKGPEP